jgi:hypothetical protein
MFSSYEKYLHSFLSTPSSPSMPTSLPFDLPSAAPTPLRASPVDFDPQYETASTEDSWTNGGGTCPPSPLFSAVSSTEGWVHDDDTFFDEYDAYLDELHHDELTLTDNDNENEVLSPTNVGHTTTTRASPSSSSHHTDDEDDDELLPYHHYQFQRRRLSLQEHQKFIFLRHPEHFRATQKVCFFDYYLFIYLFYYDATPNPLY